MAIEIDYATNWRDTLIALIVMTIVLYFMGVAQTSVVTTVRTVLFLDVVLGAFVVENYKYRYLRIERDNVLFRNGYFAEPTVVSIQSIQSMRAYMANIAYQPNLEIDYLERNGSKTSLRINTLVYHNDTVAKFIGDVWKMAPHIELDGTCRDAVQRGAWPPRITHDE
jgi:hypothetical protein